MILTVGNQNKKVAQSLKAKTWMIMKLTIVLLLFFTFQVSAKIHAQRITIVKNNIHLSEVFRDIEKQTGYLFFYDKALIKNTDPIDVSIKDATLSQALSSCLKGQGLTYSIVRNTIVIQPLKINPPPIQYALLTSEPPSIEVHGRVVNHKGQPLQNVSVMISGTKIGTTTDKDGNFTLTTLNNKNTVLEISSVGYQTKQVSVGKQTELNVVLELEISGLNNVVVIGYGTRKESNLTGAVSTISGNELAKSPVANLSNALAGSMPGLIVNTRTGEPGADDATVLIRGVGTLGNTAPLIVIDGVPDPQGGFNRLDPADIASFTVLKDATGAIYGARAANGVILITTKRGIAGKPTLTFTSNLSATQPTRLPKLLNSYQYGVASNEYDSLVGQPATFTPEQLQKYANGSDPLGYPNTNWWKTVMLPWSLQNNEVLTLSGGTDKIKYYVSGQYLHQNSMYRGGSDYYENKNVRVNLDFAATSNFHMGFNILYRNEFKLNENPNYGNQGSIFYELWGAYPFLVAKYPNGDVGVGIGGGPDNSVVYALNGDLGNTTSNYDYLQNKYSFDWDLQRVTQGLHLDGYLSYDLFNYQYKGFNASAPPAYTYDQATGTYVQVLSTQIPNLGITNSRTMDQLFNLKLDYERRFNKNFVQAFLAYEQSAETYTELDAYRSGFLANDVEELFAGSSPTATNNSLTTKTARESVISRLSYNYDERYLLDVDMRYEGSPNFPPGKRFGFFPAVAGAWRVSNEPFWHSTIIDQLKLRASYGLSGNDAVSPYQYIQTYQLQEGQITQYIPAGYFYGGTGPSSSAAPMQVPGFSLGPTPNVNITWEIARTTDVGIDMELLKTITLRLDAFTSTRSHILIPPNAAVPEFTGLTLPDENLGKVLNHGLEMDLGYKHNTNKDFSYSVGGNITFAINKVLYEAEPSSVPSYQRMTGHPTDSWLLYQALGLYQDSAQINKSAHPVGVGPGDIQYKDINGDGQINALDEVRTTQSATPEIMFGSTFSTRYKNFDATIFFQGQARAHAMLQPSGLQEALQFYTGRWLSPGDDKYPRTFNGETHSSYGSNTYSSTFWLMNDAFLRLKNVEVGYTLHDNHTLKSAGIQSIRIYVSGNNLFSIDKFGPSFDPEAPDGTSTNGEYYPQLRVINAGLSVKF